MTKKATAVLLSFCAIIYFLRIMPVSAENTTTYSYILIEADTCTVLEEKDSDIRVNAGYMTKLMTLLLIGEDIETGKYSVETELIAPQSVYGTGGAVIWLEPGDKITVDELLKGLIIGNANDSAIMLAENSEGSVEKFTARMNGEAFDLGLRNTAFYSPTGIYDEREYTTAHDIAIICSELLKFDFFTAYFQTWHDFIKDGTVELVNENTLSRTYQNHVGFKASHSENSGYCVAEGGSSDGTSYISVVLGADDSDTSLYEAKRLVKKGFSDYKVTVPGFLDELLMPIKVKKGVDEAVEIQLESQSTVVIPKGVNELSNVIVTPEYLEAPLKKYQRIGTAAFYNGDTLVYETAIITKNEVERVSYGYVLEKMLLKLIEK